MPHELSTLEARVVGCLIEKQIATPDQYPLSLNALVNACNQKSNRDPVLNLDEREVQAVVDGLIRRQVILEKSGFGSRVPKYHQLFCNTQFGSLKFSPAQTAIVCELLLRGPQTPGELRTHAGRLATVSGLDEVENALEDLETRPEGPFVVKLPREPGRRESRYAQLFTGPIDVAAMEAAQAAMPSMAAARSGRPIAPGPRRSSGSRSGRPARRTRRAQGTTGLERVAAHQPARYRVAALAVFCGTSVCGTNTKYGVVTLPPGATYAGAGSPGSPRLRT